LHDASQSIGEVEMTIRYVVPPTITTALRYSSYLAAYTPEYVRGALPGSVLLTYDAFRMTSDPTSGNPPTVYRECSSNTFTIEAKERASTTQWLSGQDSTPSPGLFTVYEGLNEVVPDMSTPHGHNPADAIPGRYPRMSNSANGATVANTVFTAMNLSVYDMLMSTDPEVQAQLDEHIQFKYFTVRDEAGNPAPGILPRFDWATLPSYNVGIHTLITPGCLTTDAYRDTIPADEVAPGLGGTLTRELIAPCGTTYQDYSVEEYGLNTMILNQFELFGRWPFNPIATVIAHKSNASGVGRAAVLIHRGHPGLYGFVLSLGGLTTTPVLLPIASRLHRIEIVQEPTNHAPLFLRIGVDLGSDAPDGTELWYVGTMGATAMLVRMVDVNGAPLAGYAPNFRPVDDHGASLEHLVLFDTSAGGEAGSGAKRGTPALEDGISTLYILLSDAVNGVRTDRDANQHCVCARRGCAWITGMHN
jgi:hypothetical protein